MGDIHRYLIPALSVHSWLHPVHDPLLVLRAADMHMCEMQKTSHTFHLGNIICLFQASILSDSCESRSLLTCWTDNHADPPSVSIYCIPFIQSTACNLSSTVVAYAFGALRKGQKPTPHPLMQCAETVKSFQLQYYSCPIFARLGAVYRAIHKRKWKKSRRWHEAYTNLSWRPACSICVCLPTFNINTVTLEFRYEAQA